MLAVNTFYFLVLVLTGSYIDKLERTTFGQNVNKSNS